MDEQDKRLCGLKYARSLNFTDQQYEEALKRIESPSNANQLLIALIDVSSRVSGGVGDNCCTEKRAPHVDDKTGFANTRNCLQDRESTSSCYSSIASFPSPSSNQSLESLHQPVTLRKVYVDGSNVARTHSKDGSFSWLGVKLCFDWFNSRKHRVKVFVPIERCMPSDASIIEYLSNLDALVRTPSGCNDDLFIIEAAKQNNGIIVSNDLYRDEKRYSDELQRFIHLNRLPFVFVDDLFIPANDPRGRSGPVLEEFLRDSCEPNHQSTKLYRSRSNQRTQKNGFFNRTNHHHSQAYHRSLQPTRSLPIERTQTVVGDIEHITNDTRLFQQANIQDSEKQQVRKTVSVTDSNPSTKETSNQPLIKRGSALCRTKSHNI